MSFHKYIIRYSLPKSKYKTALSLLLPPKKLCVPLKPAPPPTQSLATTDLFSVFPGLPFPGYHKNEIM